MESGGCLKVNGTSHSFVEEANSSSKSILPFLKWPGGKRWLFQANQNLTPENYIRYFEPFLGGGAAFFHLRPKKAVLGDKNADLIGTYKALKDDWRAVQKLLRIHHRHHCRAYYYEERARKRRSSSSRAAQFIYLNRTCWNGLYRVNQNGEFNVPKGTKTAVVLDTDDFEETAKSLATATLKASDFQKIIGLSKENDFVFIDPPYRAKSDSNGFIKYNESLFSWNDQIRLRDCILSAHERGVKILMTNTCCESIQELYADFGNAEIVNRPSVLAASAAFRGTAQELLWRNYEFGEAQ